MKSKHLSALVLAAVIIISAFVSCGEAASNAPAETTAGTAAAETAEDTSAVIPETEPRYQQPETSDLEGFVMNVATSSWINCDEMFFPESLNGDIVNDLLYNSIITVEENNNADVNLVLLPDFGSVTSAVKKAATAGSNDYQLSYNHDNQTVANALKGCFIDLNSVGFDFDAPWWTDTRESFTVDGKMMFASNYLTYSGIYLGFVIAYNKILTENMGIEVPYQSIFDGRWYMSDFISLIKDTNTDLNGDGAIKPSDDLFGFTTTDLGLVNVQVSLGATILSKDGDGMLQYTPDVDRIVNMLDKFEKLMENGFRADDGISYGATYFMKDRVLFDYVQIRVIAEELRNTDMSFGFIPCPKLDESQEKYVSGAFDVFWAIPVPAYDDADKIRILLENISYNSFYDVVPAVYETTLKVKFSESEQDAQTFEIIRDSMFVDSGYAFNEQSSGSLGKMVRLLSNTDSASAASFCEKYHDKAVAAIEKINGTYENLG